MKRYGRIEEILDQALRRLGTPPRDDVEAARERIRENLRSMNPADLTPMSSADMKRLSLWGLRQPFLIAGVVFAAVLTTITFQILSVQRPSQSVSNTLEREALRPPEAKELPRSPAAVTDLPVQQKKAIKRPPPKLLVEKAKPPEPTEPPPAIIGGLTPDPAAIPTSQPVPDPPDGDSGRDVLNRVCTVCHSLRGIEKQNYSSPDAYKDLVSEMITRGAVISDEEMATIVDYLYRTYGQK